MPHADRVDTLIFLIGPTAVGKTSLSIDLAGKLNAEIISCDSMQVYKGMSNVSQAPTASQKRTIRHHLVGILDPAAEYNVSSFTEKAATLIKKIIKKKKTPLIVGGSGLYVRALVDGLFPSPPKDLMFREKLERYVIRRGKKGLYAKLLKLDPGTAASIHPNDTRRIIRALEVYETTGCTMSRLKKNTKGLKDKYRIVMFGLIRPREEIYSLIDKRIDAMFKKGLVREVTRLKSAALSITAGAALGVKEVLGYQRGDYSLDEAKRLLKKNTRHFAKRQLAWFKPDKRIRWFDVSCLSREQIVDRIVRMINGKQANR